MTAIDDLLKKRNIQYNSPSSSSGGSPIDNLYSSLESGTYAEKRKSFFETPAQKDYTGIHADFRPQKSEEPKIEQKLKDTKISNVWNSIKQKSKQAPGALRMGLGTLIESGAKADDFLGGLIIKGFNKTFGTELQKKENILGEAGQVMRGIDFEKNMQLEDIYQKTRPESSGMARKVEDIAGSLPGTAVSLGTYGVTLALTKNPALAATAGFGTGYSQAASEIYTEARYEGLNDSDANFYASIGAPIVGAIDAIPWTNMTPQGQMTKKAVKSTLTKYLLMEMKSIGLQTLEEGTTEAVQEVVQNAVARMYNENKSLMEGVPESFIVGGILGGVTDVTMDATVGSVNYIANRPQNEPVADTVRYLQQVNSNIDKIMNKDVKKRTPQEQQIVDELLTVEISPEEAMAYIIENDLGNNPIGKQTIQQVLRAMDMNRTFASELQANLDQAMPAQSNELSSQAVRVNNRFGDELNQQLDYQLARPQRQQQYLQNEMNQQLAGLDQSVRLNNTFRNELGNQIDQMYQYPLSGEKGGQVLRRKPVRKQKAIQIKPNEETGQVEIEVVDNKESIAEMMGLVREAISAGDVGAGRAIYEGIVGNKPAFNTIVDEVNYKQKTEENRQKAETNKVIREQFGDETISKINRLKAVARGKDAKSGDIETLRNKNGELTESVIEAVREIPQYENMTDEEALQVALTLPVQAETKAKRVEKPESIKKEKTTDDTLSAVVEEEYKTEYDTPEIIEARKKANQIEETLSINTPERIKMREDLADKYYAEGAKNKNKRIDLVLGAPASGKSSRLVVPLAEEHGSLIIDSDMIKEELPEFNNGIGAGAVHKESALIADDMIFEQATENGDNIVFPRLGKKLSTMQELLDKLNKLGYETHIHFMDLPVHESAKRSVSRFEETGRFVDPDYIVNVVANKPATVYDDIKTYKGVQTYEKYTNDVPFGEKPILLEKGSNQQTKPREGVGDQRQVRAGSVGQSTETTRGTETESETEVDLLKGIEDDIDYDTAYIAYSGVSFYPERRAKSEIEGYVSQMKEDYEYLRKGIKDAEDEKIFKQGFRRYRENYKKKYLNYLNAKSRTMSSMIAGPANFPVKRNQSRLNIEQGHLDELIKFREKVLSRIKNDMNPTQIRGVGDKQLEQLETKLNDLKERQQMMKDVNKIIRSKKDVKNKIIERTGLKESTVDEIMKPDFAGRVGFPTYELTNNNANIKRLEGRVAEMRKKISNLDNPPIEHEFSDLIVNGEKFEGVDGTMVKNYAEDRYQLLFNSKPDSKVRTALKKHGFRWSPKNTAWQRQISNNADYTMRQYFGVDFKELESNQETQVVEDIPEIKIQKTDETDTIAPAKQEVIEEPIEIEEPVEVEKVVEKPTQQKPVGTGEKRKSRAYKRVRDLLEADAQLSNVDYNALNLEQDAQNAIDYIARDQDSAMQVALGLKQPPRGQTETAISIALADKLRMEGDHVTASKLEASRSLRQTRRGQEIVSERGRFNDDSPYRYVQELVNRRLYELGGKVSKAKETVSRNNKGVKQDAVNQIDTEAQAIKEILLKKQSKMEKIRQAQKIIDDLKC